MSNKTAKITRCAIYTRKSSEEGLEQEFNSLHAQREACESYIKSQKHEGWELLPAQYNDGGFSGGNMERPALKALMEEIDAGRVDVIVVYKVDRLTRSLADFAKLVEKMDAKGISFVSVTQQFNTTTSMGRLTLNVLLSFAQFEREVTGERIRDKIAMSKQKGKWMGGTVPTGYECRDHKLFVHEGDAKLIRHIFNRYVTLGSVNLLKTELDAEGYRTKRRITKNGREYGGLPFTKGNLADILKNRVYIGEIGHKGTWYPGHHEAIISAETFDTAQHIMAGNRMKHLGSVGAKSPCMLAGKLFDDRDNYMTPKHSRTRKRHYRYYTSQAIIQSRHDEAGSLPNIPAHEIEQLVKTEILKFLQDATHLHPHITSENLDQQNMLIDRASRLSFGDADEERLFYRAIIGHIVLSNKDVSITLRGENLLPALKGNYLSAAPKEPDQPISLHKKVKLAAANNGSKVVVGATAAQGNKQLLNAIVRSFHWNELLQAGKVKSLKEIQDAEGLKTDRYISRILRLRFLAPDIIRAIVEGTAPAHWTVEQLFRIKALNWNEQRQQLAFN